MINSLEQYSFPEDLKTMSIAEMELLAIKIREFLIENISRTGGHLASNLGVVELTIALHKLFDTPSDKIIWDVGHQSYVHKILTGRVDGFKDLRQLGGMSGFPRKQESPYDAFNTGHSSTSISIVAGMAKARDIQGGDYQTVAVIGDGALTGGLAYEGLNNLGVSKTKAIIVINDNGMSIAKNKGGISTHLGKLRVSEGYYDFKKKVGGAVKKIPAVGENMYKGMEKFRDTLKYALVDGVLFEELGFTYLGPVDGHNIKSLLENLSLAKSADGPVVLHIITKKGKGYRNAEENPGKFHGTGPFDPLTGSCFASDDKLTYSKVFGNTMLELAEKDNRITAITAAMRDGVGLTGFEKKFPDRFFDAGIAEGHAVTFAAGLAAAGMKPVFAVYSTFLQRAYDNIISDVCLQELPVVFAVDRAGVVGADGETHHGIFDLTFLGHMPNLQLMAPADGRELAMMLKAAVAGGKPCAIRYPKGEESDLPWQPAPIAEGADVVEKGADVEIWALGALVKNGAAAREMLKNKGLDAGIVNARFMEPIDDEKLLASAERTSLIVTLEDNIISGGFGEKAAAVLCRHDAKCRILSLGWPDTFIEHGTVAELYDKYGLSAEKIAERICEELERKA